jgi:hypothetical protein
MVYVYQFLSIVRFFLNLMKAGTVPRPTPLDKYPSIPKSPPSLLVINRGRV